MDQSSKNKRIQSKLARRKKYLLANEPICIFCLHLITPAQIRNGEADLCHKIRRSEKSDLYDDYTLQVMDLNTGLGHRECHDIYDNSPEEAVKLPGFEQVLLDIYKIDQHIFNKCISNLYFRYLGIDSLLWMYYNLGRDKRAEIMERELKKCHGINRFDLEGGIGVG